MGYVCCSWGRKDAFPGADGSTIQQIGGNNAQTISIYGASGNTLTEGSTTGFRLVNITTEGVLSESTSQVYTIKNPLTFIYNTKAPGDWYTNSATYQDNTLWGDGTDKSDFDPCPSGWRVVSIGTWDDFTQTLDNDQPLNGTFPYYIKGIAKVQDVAGNYHQTNGRMYKVSTTGMGTPLVWYPAGGNRNFNSGLLFDVGRDGCNWSASSNGYLGANLNFLILTLKVSMSVSRAYGQPVRCVQE